MKKERELPVYTLLNPEFHLLEGVSANDDYSQEKSEKMPNQDENYPSNEK